MSAPGPTRQAAGTWLDALARAREDRVPAVLVTVATVRGHAPRAAGAKMVVTADGTWDSVGGGDLEAEAVTRARTMLATGAREPVALDAALTEHAPTRHGVQCCGGEVTLLLDPVPVPPAVCVVGLGHVGAELVRVLSRHDLDLHLVDSREAYVAPYRRDRGGPPAALLDARARLHPHHCPVPELGLTELPTGTHVLVMTHDHAEDVAVVDVALRTDRVASIGLIGSAAKRSRFERRLRAEGHDDAALARVRTPVGLTDLPGKEPATIALGIAVELLRILAEQPATTPAATR
ncbi:xanthine dehydrogenase accessory protein XdhC [Lapillicoccus jejuensis]|uniref:Molybdenum cofactor sulfurylase n=1 Tax=Lapillicoccus jejuensis TaxID=402171 RepID=A0A542E1P2_9MICO|nr:xanthine dehydrogenase accessory protein XdhC [Lapillicoccus jejuensis]TQJ09261.1 molybdenum cofactor sulfurylase [Lapillicoccus jejuensis]